MTNAVATKHRFSLEQYRGPATRHRCPRCDHNREFTRYIDTETGNYLADHVGKCNRELRCGYHFKPRDYFAENPQAREQGPRQDPAASWVKAPKPPRPIDYLPAELVYQTRRHFKANNLWLYLAATIGEAAATSLFDKYRVGTSKHWPGATAFWQIDTANNVRQCRVMLYDPATGHRVKEPYNYVFLAGKKLIGRHDANLMQCFFGAHLLPLYPAATVAIVESEKTAMYCAHIYPDLVWLATGGKHGCRWTEKAVFEPLRGRNVVLFPDLSATAEWQQKAQQVAAKVQCRIAVSTDLEQQASEADRAAGLDLMDYLIREGATQPTEASKPEPAPAAISEATKREPVQARPPIGPNGYPAEWDEPATATTPPQQAPEPQQAEPLNLQWFIAEANKWFARSLIKDPAKYYPAFITSYRPTLQKLGIDEKALRAALNL